MKKVFILVVFLIFKVSADSKNSFIMPYEYGEMLYKNPRGIGCNKCHGKRGKGMIIAKYKHKGKTKMIKTKDIRGIAYIDFLKIFQDTPPSIMPKYHLTQNELHYIYYYLTNKKE